MATSKEASATTTTNGNGGPAPIPDAHLLYTTVRLNLAPAGAKGGLQMNILKGQYRGLSLAKGEGGIPQGMICAREMMPASGIPGVFFDMNQGDMNLVEVHVQGVRGGPGTTFLQLEFVASGGPFIVRMFVPGYVSVDPYVHAGKPVRFTIPNTSLKPD